MKKFALIALAVLSLLSFASQVRSQEYAPLVQKDTTSIVRFNLDALKADQLGDQVQKVGVAAVDFFVEDAEQAENAKQVLPIAKVFIAQYYAQYVQPLKNYGVKNIYLIVDASDDDTKYPYLAIPTGNLTSDQLTKVRSFLTKLNQDLNKVVNYRFVRNNFLFIPFIPADWSDEDAKAYVRENFTKLQTVDKPQFEEGFKASGADSNIITTVTIPYVNEAKSASQIEELLATLKDHLDEIEGISEDDFRSFLEQVSEINVTCSKLVKYTAAYINDANLELATIVEGKTEDDAKRYQQLQEKDLTEDIVAFIQKIVTNVGGAQEINPETLNDANDIVDSAMKMFMKYDRQGSTITWKLNEKFFSDNKDTIAGIVEKVKGIAARGDLSINVEGSEDSEDSEDSADADGDVFDDSNDEM